MERKHGTRGARRQYVIFTHAILVMLVTGCGVTAWGQVTNEITAISPDSAAQGTVGLLVTFTLDTDVPPPPPAGVMPDSVTLGALTGMSVTHDSQYTVTAIFDIPFDELPGAKDAAVVFTTPHGTLTFSMAGGFTVVAGADTPPTISQQPQSRTVQPGGSATFTMAAWGTAPLSYQWQKDAVDIAGATGASYTIDPVDWADAGDFRCVVSNDFGSATSDVATLTVAELTTGAYPIVDTGQDACFDDMLPVNCPAPGTAFYGQDAQVDGLQPNYTVSADGLTVHDNITGLTWTRSPDLDGDGDIDVDDKLSFDNALTYADDVLNPASFGGYNDWRLPSMKELYSLMDFRGTDPSPDQLDPNGLVPYIDTDYFAFGYGDIAAGERIIDAQFWSTNVYLGTVFGDQQATFGLNLADGRIKGYPSGNDGPVIKLNYVYFVRGNTDYGINDLVDNGDGTITDRATGLMWTQDDSGYGMNWESALAWAEQKNAENHLGHSDWRLPNAKELQSIVDYARCPDVTNSAAIDPVFNCTPIFNLGGQVDYPWYWTGTTHIRADGTGANGVYVAFGRGTGSMDGVTVMDVHGAGCQRSDPKDGDPNDYPLIGFGPQGDVQRVFNYVRLVRDADIDEPNEPYPGYNLFAPLGETETYLMDNDGNVVQSWQSTYGPGNSVYLLDNGHILRTGSVGNTSFPAGGAGGIVQEFGWCGELVWEYEYSSAQYLQHHDIEPLPNGNVLMVAWEHQSQAEALAAGRNPALLSAAGLYPDTIIEVQPTGPDTGQIVWAWHAWDHLVQDYDPTQANYGVVADHPELIDINYASSPDSDWNHVNSIDYNAELDQIVLSVRNFGEIWVIDHSTTTAEAAGHTGGNSGMGGDLLYRWGNPQTYGAGTTADQQLFVQHDAEWIAAGCPGAGNILVFNNGQGRPGGNCSSVDEIVPPLNPDGSYALAPGAAYGPAAPVWSYVADPSSAFYADHISGSQRLPNGNTLICDGPAGRFFEVTASGTTTWEYEYLGGGGPAGGQVFKVERHGLDEPAFSSARFTAGDLNCDCAVDFSDINPFVLALTAPSDYAAGYPDCDEQLADINDDGVVDFDDINPYVALLTGR